MSFNMAGWSPFTKVIDDKEIKRLSEESKISIPEIKGVIKEMSDTGGGGQELDFTYDDVKNAVMEKFDGPDSE
jgi:hypothetical protein